MYLEQVTTYSRANLLSCLFLVGCWGVDLNSLTPKSWPKVKVVMSQECALKVTSTWVIVIWASQCVQYDILLITAVYALCIPYFLEKKPHEFFKINNRSNALAVLQKETLKLQLTYCSVFFLQMRQMIAAVWSATYYPWT